MDGLVLDTESSYFIAWQKAAQAMGYELSEDFCRSLSGLHYQAVEQRIQAHCGTLFNCHEFARLSGIYWRETVMQQGISVKKGFFSIHAAIQKRQIPYCLATNSRKNNTQECLRFAGLEKTFTVIVSRDCVTKGKPSPEIFFKAAELLTVPISECLILEDSAIGIEAAMQTPAYPIYIPSEATFDQDVATKAAFVCNDLQMLAEMIMLVS